jgi:hypothetical protein
VLVHVYICVCMLVSRYIITNMFVYVSVRDVSMCNYVCVTVCSL